MLVKKLDVIVYPDAGPFWHTETHDEPAWELIENAVRDLDRAEHPFLNIYLHGGRGKSELWYLVVIGGAGEYGISGNNEDWQECWRYRDKSRPKGPDLIDIWITDQGASFEKTYLCNDLDLVLKICRHFAETGELAPDCYWERRGQ
jgi:hypothetical protein